MTAPGAGPRVVYIMGSGRSGTTLVGSILDEHAGVFNAGELSYLWERGILEPRGCGCGRAPLECPVWGPVIEQVAAGRDPRTLARRLLDLRGAIRLRNTRRIVSGPPIAGGRAAESDGQSPLLEYGAVLRDVYFALASETGSNTIIDTSKHPADAALLGRLTGIRPTFVHIVRDPRAVANSWRRRKQGIARRKVPLAATDWLLTNRAADLVRHRHPVASTFVRYEDLMAAPRAVIQGILELAGIATEPTPFVDERTVMLGANHTVSGNPDRFVAGPTTLRLDDRWREEMPGPTRVLVTALAWPGMRHYHYSLRS
jgi:sulfotransferase family protein